MKNKFDLKDGKAGIVIPFWSDGNQKRFEYLNMAIDSILQQSDGNFIIYLVDDGSTDDEIEQKLEEIRVKDERIRIITSTENKGPGAARNLGIREAYNDGCPFISFLDSDDMFHKNKIRDVRIAFQQEVDADIVYTNFLVVDENNNYVEQENLVEGIKRIQNDMKKAPLEGYDIWREIVMSRDNLTIPSALSVKTDIAYRVLFPSHVRFHEDTYTWLRYSAYGAKVKYLSAVPTYYRVIQSKGGSESRERAGGREEFNRLRVKVIMEGLEEALVMAEKRNVIEKKMFDVYKVCYLLNVASIIKYEDTPAVVDEILYMARNISSKLYDKFIEQYDIQ